MTPESIMDRLSALEAELGTNYFGTFFTRLVGDYPPVDAEDVRKAVLDKLAPVSDEYTRVFLRLDEDWLGLYVEHRHDIKEQVVTAVRSALAQFTWHSSGAEERPARTYADGEFYKLVSSADVLQTWKLPASVRAGGAWVTQSREVPEAVVHQIVSAWYLAHGDTLYCPLWDDEWDAYYLKLGVKPPVFMPHLLHYVDCTTPS